MKKMKHTHDDLALTTLLQTRLLSEIRERYGVDDNLASEMAWDFMEILTATDASLETLDKYILH